MIKNLKNMLGFGQVDPVQVDDKNRFYYMLQQMQANRWRITAIVLGLFFFILLGINPGVFIGAEINEDWKEMLQAGLLEEVVVGQTLLLEQVVMRHLVLVVTGVTVLLLASQALL